MYVAIVFMDLGLTLHRNDLVCFYDWQAGASQPSHVTGKIYISDAWRCLASRKTSRMEDALVQTLWVYMKFELGELVEQPKLR